MRNFLSWNNHLSQENGCQAGGSRSFPRSLPKSCPEHKKPDEFFVR
jgi:hypothetical protein